jgi:hypothetical protein
MIMKKITYLSAVILSISLASCGGSEVCNCMDAELQYSKERGAATTPEKVKEVDEKFKSDKEACVKLYNDSKDKAALRKEAEACESSKKK